MEFDSTKVYSAFTADDLPIGSRCYFADNIKDLKSQVRENSEDNLFTLKEVFPESSLCRFSISEKEASFEYAYLVELPKEESDYVDMNRLYSALNAENLEIGSQCYFADFVDTMKNKIKNNEKPDTLIGIKTEDYSYRFIANSNTCYRFAYLCTPFSENDIKDFVKILDNLHEGWVKHKTSGTCYRVTSYNKNRLFLGIGNPVALKDVIENFVYADDDSPISIQK